MKDSCKHYLIHVKKDMARVYKAMKNNRKTTLKHPAFSKARRAS
jgi:hypothetical protein